MKRTAQHIATDKAAFAPIVVHHARAFGVPEDLALALVSQESAWDPYAVSKTGAMGLGQLMPATAKQYQVSDPFDPSQNAAGAMAYLGAMIGYYRKQGSSSPELLAVAAYNAGAGAVRKHKGVPPYAETQQYVTRIRQRMGREYA